MRRVGASLGVLAVLACPGEPAAPPPLLQASILRASDTVRFEAPAAAHRCSEGKGIVIDAAGRGNGLLIWLADTSNTWKGSFPVVGVHDTVTKHRAVVSVRFIASAVAHTLSLDSGTVMVRDSAGGLQIGVTGAGLDLNGGARPHVKATFRALRPPADSASCVRVP